MKLTLLLDLDDTLLENDIYKFLPHYLKALGSHLSEHVAPDRMIKELLAGTDAMTRKTRPSGTLEEAFDQVFYPAVGVNKDVLHPTLVDFYERIFPSLRSLTRPIPAAARLVNRAIEMGCTLAVATNPLFPLRAIQHRLEWAGLPVDHFPFALVSSYETFHFAKPHPAFIAECLAQLGWPDQPAVMIGNSLSDDLLPAAVFGIPGYLISSTPADISGLPAGSGQGNLDGALEWLENLTTLQPAPALATPEAVLAELNSTPAVLDTFGRSFDAARWNIPPQNGEWCFTEIICHLRDADQEINLPRLDRILSQANSFVAAVNADSWTETREYCNEAGEEALRGFFESRTTLIQRLEQLSPAEWETPASHAIFGPTTIRELATFVARHDLTHVQQALRTFSAARDGTH